MIKSICIEKLFTEYPFYDRFKTVREAGFDYLEFGTWEQHDLKIIKGLLEKYHLKVACFSADKDYNLIDPTYRTEFIEYFKKSVEVANYLGCKNLVLHSNALGPDGTMCTAGNECSDRTKIANATRVLLEIAPIAEAGNVLIQLEPVSTYIKPGYYMTTTPSAADIVRVINSPNLKVLYDVYHMQMMEGDLIHTIRKYIDVIGYIHIGDVPERYEPGTGEVNFTRFKEVLIGELGYRGYFGFELYPKTDMATCLKALHAF